MTETAAVLSMGIVTRKYDTRILGFDIEVWPPDLRTVLRTPGDLLKQKDDQVSSPHYVLHPDPRKAIIQFIHRQPPPQSAPRVFS